jgi:hypothetical protein
MAGGGGTSEEGMIHPMGFVAKKSQESRVAGIVTAFKGVLLEYVPENHLGGFKRKFWQEIPPLK